MGRGTRLLARRWLAFLPLLACFGVAAPAYGDWPSGSRIVGFTALGLLVPSEVGAVASSERGDFVFGWSWQIPLTVFALLAEDSSNRGKAPSRWLGRQRIVGGLELFPGRSDGHVRGRLGYRFSLPYFFAGLGGTVAAFGNTWSPELGVRFVHTSGNRDDGIWDPAFHILIRPDIAPAFDHIRALTVLLGWTFI